METLLKDLELATKDKPLLSTEDIATLLGCSVKVIYNWTRRIDPERRPPRVVIGRQVKFPRTEFFRWLVKEQNRR